MKEQPESIKVIRYMINIEKKNIAKEIIYALQNNKPDEYLNHLYARRARINWADKYFKS